MTAAELAKLVIATLDTQKEYFQTRDHATLMKSKALEKQLRSAANKALGQEPPPSPKSGNLFGGDAA